MAWLLLTTTAVLAVLVLVLAALVVRLSRRVGSLEQAPSRVPADRFSTVDNLREGRLDEPPAPAATPEFVITQVGVAEPEPVATVPAPMFADIVARETVIQTASLLQGVRRALAPETRNRIRFQMRQEVKRSRKQRRTELRDVRREWAARQRAATPDTAA